MTIHLLHVIIIVLFRPVFAAVCCQNYFPNRVINADMTYNNNNAPPLFAEPSVVKTST